LAAFVVAAGALAGGCFSGEGTPVSGPDKASCASGYPPANVQQPADFCGVQPLVITRNDSAIPTAPGGKLELDLYIEGDHTCGLGPSGAGALCAVDDNRPFAPAGTADPQADPTRNRVHMVIDFDSQTLTLQVSPSCRIHAVDIAGAGGFNGSKECFAPNNIGQGTDLSTSSLASGAVEVKLNVLQTAYYASPGKLGQIENTFDFAPQPDGSINFTENGTDFPDLAVIRNGTVACADQATHITDALLPAVGANERTVTCTIPPTTPQGTSGAQGATVTGSELCNDPKLVDGQPAYVVVMLDGVGSTEPDGGTFYPVPVASPPSGVPVVTNYCPLNPDGSERAFPAGLSDSIHRWSEFNAPGGSSGSSGPAVSQACERTGGFDHGACLTQSLADAGAVILPYSYTGSTLGPDGQFSQSSYSSGDSKQPLCTSVAQLDAEIGSIHASWPQAGIVVVGHSYGGLVAETWWYGNNQPDGGDCSVSTGDSGVFHVFSLDSPINGVRACARAHLYAGDASSTWCDLWGSDDVHGEPNGLKIAVVDDRALAYTAVGTPNDPTYGNGPLSGGGGLHDQLVYDCIDNADENDPTSQCIDRTGGSLPVSYTSPSSQCDASSGNIYGSKDHDLVKACPDVIRLIVSAFQPPAPKPKRRSCSIPGGAEGGAPLDYSVRGLSCSDGAAIIESNPQIGESAPIAQSSGPAQGFACLNLGPQPIQPGSQIRCRKGPEIVRWGEPG